MSGQQHDDDSVRHLLALGYVDPVEVSARETISQRRYFAELQRLTHLAEQGRGAEALPDLEKLAESEPDRIAPRQLLAETHYGAGRWKEALESIDWLVCHGIESPRLALMAGAIALARRDPRGALDHLEYACQASPDLPGAFTLFGQALFRVGRLPDAERAFRRALERDPSDARALDGLAAAELRRGEFELATDSALRALDHDFRLYRAHYHLGVALTFLGQTEAAVTTFETCLKLDPARCAPYYWLTKIAAEQLHDPARAGSYRECRREIIRRRQQQRVEGKPRNG